MIRFGKSIMQYFKTGFATHQKCYGCVYNERIGGGEVIKMRTDSVTGAIMTIGNGDFA